MSPWSRCFLDTLYWSRLVSSTSNCSCAASPPADRHKSTDQHLTGDVSATAHTCIRQWTKWSWFDSVFTAVERDECEFVSNLQHVCSNSLSKPVQLETSGDTAPVFRPFQGFKSPGNTGIQSRLSVIPIEFSPFITSSVGTAWLTPMMKVVRTTVYSAHEKKTNIFKQTRLAS